MNRTTLLTATATVAGAALVMLGSGGSTLNAAKASSAPKDIQVKSTIDDADQATAVPYLIASDGFGPYVSTSDGLVTSILQGSVSGNKEWRLDTYALVTVKGKLAIKRSNRTAAFQFSEPVDSSTQPPTDLRDGPVMANVHMFSTCDADLATMSPQTYQDCAGAFRLEPINDNDTGYRLAFQPENSAEVTRMRMTCTAGSAGNCTAWTVSPGADANGATYTGLDGLARSKNQLLSLIGTSENVASALGDYYFSFNISVTRN